MDRGATNVLLNYVKLSHFHMTEKFEKMSNLDVALASFLQLTRHWQQGEAAKL